MSMMKESDCEYQDNTYEKYGWQDREPLQEEVKAAFAADLACLTWKGLHNRFNKDIPARPFVHPVRNYIDFKEAISGYKHAAVLDNAILDVELSSWANLCESTYMRDRNAIFKECMIGLHAFIEKHISDQDYGLYYAKCLLHNAGIDKYDILKRLEEERNTVSSFQAAADKREDYLKMKLYSALDNARRNRFVPFRGISAYKEYTEAVFSYYDHIRIVKLAPIVGDFYDRLIAAATDYSHTL